MGLRVVALGGIGARERERERKSEGEGEKERERGKDGVPGQEGARSRGMMEDEWGHSSSIQWATAGLSPRHCQPDNGAYQPPFHTSLINWEEWEGKGGEGKGHVLVPAH